MNPIDPRIPLVRADLHVHSCHSREFLTTRPWRVGFRAARTPEAIYRLARKAGMAYVTITDHDTIAGCLELLSRRPEVEPRFTIGEEVTSYYPGSGAELHISVLGLDEGQHRSIQKVRRDLVALVEYLRHEGLVYALNHPIWDARGRRWTRARLRELLQVLRDHFTGIETRNGAAFEVQNRVASRLAERLGAFAIGGSDTHTDQVGYAYTCARARTKEEFLAAVREGRARVGGRQLTGAYFAHEARQLVVANFRPPRIVGALSGRALVALADVLYRRVSGIAADLYLRAQRGVLSVRDRSIALDLGDSP